MAEYRRHRSPLVSRRHVVIGGSLAAASSLAFARQPQVHLPAVAKDKFEKWVPTRFGAWSVIGTSGVVLPPPDALSDRLYDNLVTRVYEATGEPPVMMLLAYNNLQDGIVQVHRPEVCYPVGGYELSATRKISLVALGKELPVNLFTAKAPNRTEHVLYFTRLGTAYPRNWGEQRWTVIKENIAGRIPDGMMMRVSLLGLSQEEALAKLAQFTRQFIAASPPGLRNLLLV